MPRTPPHFKVRCTVANHEKMAAVYADNDLFALWVRLGIKAVERFADRNGGTFIVHDSELDALTGKGRADVARRLLEHLADVSPISAQPSGYIWRITIPNFAEKQGFRKKNGSVMEVSASASASASTTKEEDKIPVPAAPPGADAPEDVRLVPAKAPRKAPEPPPQWAVETAEMLASTVARRWPGVAAPRSPAAWAREIARVRAGDDIVVAIVRWYCDAARDGDGGRGVAAYTPEVRSGRTLREKWPQLVAARQRDRGSANVESIEEAIAKRRAQGFLPAKGF
jgi:hypothetical protein